MNLSEEQIRGNHNPGAGGWPTIRYFNAETGIAGASYVKKTDDAMCTELGNDKYMTGYIMEAGKTSLCSAETGKGCSEKEADYISKMKAKSPEEITAQVERLEKMSGSSMKPELEDWKVRSAPTFGRACASLRLRCHARAGPPPLPRSPPPSDPITLIPNLHLVGHRYPRIILTPCHPPPPNPHPRLEEQAPRHPQAACARSRLEGPALGRSFLFSSPTAYRGPHRCNPSLATRSGEPAGSDERV